MPVAIAPPLVASGSVLVRTAVEVAHRHRAVEAFPGQDWCPRCGTRWPCGPARHAREVCRAAGMPTDPHNGNTPHGNTPHGSTPHGSTPQNGSALSSPSIAAPPRPSADDLVGTTFWGYEAQDPFDQIRARRFIADLRREPPRL